MQSNGWLLAGTILHFPTLSTPGSFASESLMQSAVSKVGDLQEESPITLTVSFYGQIFTSECRSEVESHCLYELLQQLLCVHHRTALHCTLTGDDDTDDDDAPNLLERMQSACIHDNSIVALSSEGVYPSINPG